MIRKGLIEYFKYCESSGSKTANTIDISDIIAWIEKQSQTYTKKDMDIAYFRGVYDASKNK